MEIVCPSCQGGIEAGPEWAGHVMSCPHCSSQLTVPAIAPQQSPVMPAIPPPSPHLAGQRGAAQLQNYYQKKKMSGWVKALIALGCLGLVALGFIILVVAPKARQALQTMQLLNGRVIYSEIRVYSNDQLDPTRQLMGDFSPPESLDELVPKYLEEEQLSYKRTSDRKFERFLYFPAVWDNHDFLGSNDIIIASQDVYGGKRAVVFTDGTARVIPEEEYQASRAKQ